MPLVHEAVKKLICVQDRTLQKRGEGGSSGVSCDLEEAHSATQIEQANPVPDLFGAMHHARRR